MKALLLQMLLNISKVLQQVIYIFYDLFIFSNIRFRAPIILLQM